MFWTKQGISRKGLIRRKALKILAVMLAALAGNASTKGAAYDLSLDFSPTNNPAGVWSFGAKPSLDGTFSLFTVRGLNPFEYWQLVPSQEPTIYRNGTTETIQIGEQGAFPSGTVFLYSGSDGATNGFGAVRFTAPSAGSYLIQTEVAPVYDGSSQGDTDFHVVKNGAELFGRFLAPADSSSYSNELSLAAGDTLDFMVGRGQDDIGTASGLKIQVTITPASTPPSSELVVNGSFELGIDPEISAGVNAPDSTTITGWTVEAASVDYIGTRWTAGNGVRCLDLSGTDAGTISQVISGLTPGQAYRLSFLMAGNPEVGLTLVRLRAGVGAASGEFSFSPSGHSPASMGWTEKSLDFVAESASEKLSFVSLVPGWAGAALDRIAITVSTSPPPSIITFDLSEDFSRTSNPNGPWTYGYLTTLGGTFGASTASRTFSADNGVPIAAWEFNTYQPPGVWKVLGPGEAHSDGTHFTAAPGTIYFAPGGDGAPQNFGAIRFTVPAGGAGNYLINTSVRSLFDGARSREADFHVLKNGTELFGQFLAPNSATGYSNIVALAAGDTIDFAIGRGADGLAADTGLKIQATLTRTTTTPPVDPPQFAVYDVARDFSQTANPNGPWSYGWKASTSGAFARIPFAEHFFAENGVPLFTWKLNANDLPSVSYVVGPGTAVSAAGQFVAEPGTLYFTAGADGTPYNFGAIRFTVPAGGAGSYRIETAVRDLFDGFYQGDTDFHVVHNGVEVFGQFVAVHTTAGYSNTLALAEGDTVDFLIGRGQDGHQNGSGLKLVGTLTLGTNAPPQQPSVVHNLGRDFALVNPNGVWSYGHQSAIGAPLNLMASHQIVPGDNGVPILLWHTQSAPAIYGNTNATTATSGGQSYPPNTAWCYAGPEGSDRTFAVMRFTVPANGAGDYLIASAVSPRVTSGGDDSDFHVARNGVELFGQFLGATESGGYTNSVGLEAGDTIDFLVGRGANGRLYGSGLRIQATISLQSNTPRPPQIIAEPQNQTVVKGSTVAFAVSASGSSPLSYQWLFNEDPIDGANASTLTLDNVQLSQSGNYSVVVSNELGTATSANAVLVVYPPSATVRLVDANGAGAAEVSVPVELVANGNENAVGFSLNFNASVLGFVGASLGLGAPSGATLLVNTNDAAAGRLGLVVGLPADQAFAEGTQQVARVTFLVAPILNQTTVAVSFGDQPTLRQLSDVRAQVLPAVFVGGTVSIADSQFEGDVAPRPNGDRSVATIDWVQMGRYVARLDAISGPNEFQRADCAPRAERGNGKISVSDWVQAGRYAVGLDPLAVLGGPTEEDSGEGGFAAASASSRQLGLVNTTIAQGQTNAVSVTLACEGNENATSFSVVFDPAKLAFINAAPGAGSAGSLLNLNTSETTQGRLGVALAAQPGKTFKAGSREILQLRFTALATAPATASLTFGNAPVPSEVSDVTANALPTGFTAGTVSVTPPPGPPLRVTRSGNSLFITWPSSAAGFELEATEGALGTAWSLVPGVIDLGEQKLAVISIGSRERYFRLKKP